MFTQRAKKENKKPIDGRFRIIEAITMRSMLRIVGVRFESLINSEINPRRPYMGLWSRGVNHGSDAN